MFVKRCCVYHFFASGSQEGEWNLRENCEKKWLSLTCATKVGVSWSGKEQLHKLCAVDCSVQVDHARCWSCGYFAFAAINQKVKNNMERGRSLEGVLFLFFWQRNFGFAKVVASAKVQRGNKKHMRSPPRWPSWLMLVRWSTQADKWPNTKIALIPGDNWAIHCCGRVGWTLSQFKRKTTTEKENPDHVSLKHAANETRINQLEKIKS